MTDVALREELARAMMRVAFDPSDKDVVRYYARDWNARLDDADAILPIIARERAAALAAATPLIEARVTAALVDWLRSRGDCQSADDEIAAWLQLQIGNPQ